MTESPRLFRGDLLGFFMLAAAALLLASGTLSAQGSSGTAAGVSGKKDYKIGEPITGSGSGKSGGRVKSSRAREIRWEDLIPKEWDPGAAFKGLDLASLKDSDPRAIEALALLRTTWDNAPTNPELNGVAVRIPGFIVPLERDGRLVRELLLVPYFGACIHVPPPPANQIIHVTVDPPLKDAMTMDTFWIRGKLETVRTPSSFGASGYRMRAALAEPYRELPK